MKYTGKRVSDGKEKKGRGKKQSASGGNAIRRFWQNLSGTGRGVLILILALILLAILCVCAARLWMSPPSGNENTMLSKITSVDPETGEMTEVETEIPASHKEKYYNILLAGTDEDGTRTDTIIIARLDANDNTVAMMSVPRDTLVNGRYTVPKINSVYGAAGGGEDGMEALEKQLKSILGFDVDGYVLVDIDGFVELVDLLGGVDFDVPRNMYYNDPTQDLYINLAAGYQHLNGEQAMWLVRYRSGYANADLGRVEVQRDFLKAVVEQCLQTTSLSKIKGMADIAQKYVLSDLSVGNMVYLASELSKCNLDTMETFTLEGEGIDIRGGSYLALHPNAVLEVVNQAFNPYDTDITLSNVSIRTSGGSSGGSSSGSGSSGGSSSGSSSSGSGSSGGSSSGSGSSGSESSSGSSASDGAAGSSILDGEETPETPAGNSGVEEPAPSDVPDAPAEPPAPEEPVTPEEPAPDNSASSVLGGD